MESILKRTTYRRAKGFGMTSRTAAGIKIIDLTVQITGGVA